MTRNFLLFLPTENPNLKEVFSYYSSTVKVNPEGDVHVSDESRRGLGTNPFISLLFGIFVQISHHRPQDLHCATRTHISRTQQSTLPAPESNPNAFPWDPGEQSHQSMLEMPVHAQTLDSDTQEEVHLLTSLFPDPGYFLAGGTAGAVSRTATAPLDRLKVYLIAQTSVKKDTVDAVRSGAPLQAAKSALRPIMDATVSLWKMGGVRSLFAGEELLAVALKLLADSKRKWPQCFESYAGVGNQVRRLRGMSMSSSE